MTALPQPTATPVIAPVVAEAVDARAIARSRELADLLARRPDLVGVHPPADTVAATVTWAV